MQPRPVAGDGYRAMMKGKAMVVTGLQNKVLAVLARFTPRTMLSRIARTLQESSAQPETAGESDRR